MISICLIPYSLCILDAAHDRILSVRTSYSHYFTNCYEATNLRNLLIHNYWSNFYTSNFYIYNFYSDDRILSVRTSYSHYFTNCYEATNLRNLLIHNYWSNFYTKYLLRGSLIRYPFPTILSGHKCILLCTDYYT